MSSLGVKPRTKGLRVSPKVMIIDSTGMHFCEPDYTFNEEDISEDEDNFEEGYESVHGELFLYHYVHMCGSVNLIVVYSA